MWVTCISRTWYWFLCQATNTVQEVLLPVKPHQGQPSTYTFASTLAHQWQTVKLLITSLALDTQKGQSAWPEEMVTKLPRRWQKLHSCPVFPRQSCSVMPPKEAGKKWESCRVLILPSERIPRHFVKINDKGIISNLAINWDGHQSFLWNEFSLFWDRLSLLQNVAKVPKSKFSSLLEKQTLFVLLLPNSSFPWPFLLQFTLLGQNLAVQERKHSSVAEEGWLWPFLSAVYNSCRAVCWSPWQAVSPFSTVWDWVIRDEAPVCRRKQMFRDRRRQHAVQQIASQSLIHSLVKGCKVSGYAWWQRNQGPRLDITETSQKDDTEGKLWG